MRHRQIGDLVGMRLDRHSLEHSFEWDYLNPKQQQCSFIFSVHSALGQSPKFFFSIGTTKANKIRTSFIAVKIMHIQAYSI